MGGMKVETRDCVVIGGGPAGSTFAAIVAKYAPDLSVTVLERAHHPAITSANPPSR